MRALTYILLVTAVLPVSANAEQTKSIMMEMKLDYLQAVNADNAEQMRQSLAKLALWIEKAKQQPYPPQKHAIYLQGFHKLSSTIAEIERQLAQGDWVSAQAKLQDIDALRIEYHGYRSSSIWRRLLG